MDQIQQINRKLEQEYGKVDDLRPYWRVVYSDDQFEKQLRTHTDEGFQLLTPEVREVPKYRQWIQHKYILEKLTPIPEENQHELPESHGLSYEPLWVFEDSKGNALPPRWDAIQLIIKTVHDAIGYKGTKYKDPYSDPKTAPEIKQKEIEGLEHSLFGNETNIGDALAYKEGVGYTGPTKVGEENVTTTADDKSIRVPK